MEAKSYTNFRGRKFKKSDLLSENRRLRYVIQLIFVDCIILCNT